MKTPSSASSDSTLSTMAWMSSMWAKTLVAVTILRPAVPALHFVGALRSEERVERRNAGRDRELAGVGRLDAADPMPAAMEVAEQRAVVRSDVDDQVLLRERKQLHHLAVQLGEVLAQDAGRAAGVRVVRREDDVRVHDQPELHQRARLRSAGARPDSRLLVGPRADRVHRVDRRQIAEEQDRTQVRRAADLAALDEDAAAGSGGFLDRVGNLGHGDRRLRRSTLAYQATVLAMPASSA